MPNFLGYALHRLAVVLGFKAGWPKARHSVRTGAVSMVATWIVLSIVGWVLGLLFVMILMRMAGGEDRAARHAEKRLDPFSDVSITQTGVG